MRFLNDDKMDLTSMGWDDSDEERGSSYATPNGKRRQFSVSTPLGANSVHFKPKKLFSSFAEADSSLSSLSSADEATPLVSSDSPSTALATLKSTNQPLDVEEEVELATTEQATSASASTTQSDTDHKQPHTPPEAVKVVVHVPSTPLMRPEARLDKALSFLEELVTNESPSMATNATKAQLFTHPVRQEYKNSLDDALACIEEVNRTFLSEVKVRLDSLEKNLNECIQAERDGDESNRILVVSHLSELIKVYEQKADELAFYVVQQYQPLQDMAQNQQEQALFYDCMVPVHEFLSMLANKANSYNTHFKLLSSYAFSSEGLSTLTDVVNKDAAREHRPIVCSVTA